MVKKRLFCLVLLFFVSVHSIPFVDNENSPFFLPDVRFRSPFLADDKPVIKTRADPSYRLPKTTKPISYTLDLTIDPDEPELFWGIVTINVIANEAVKKITLHAKDLNITSHSVATANLPLIGTTIGYNKIHDFLEITLRNDLQVNKEYTLKFNYTGKYGQLNGLYRSWYQDGSRTIYLATTHFEPVAARKAFPCYDEPHLKATFSLKVQIPSGYHAISNMPAIEALGDNLRFKNVKFQTSPLMSTYLLTFIISDFEFKTNIQGSKDLRKPFRVWARPNAVKALDYSLKFGEKSLEHLINFTNTEYRMPKMDNVAVPHFSAGAMENWGIITYREEYLLHESGKTSTKLEQSIATVMSHENGHMWFGNEVSPEWWDYLWLSEGFATYFEHYTTDQVMEGKWRLMEQFVVNSLQSIMVSDYGTSTNPMNNEVYSPSEISNNFNGIAYQKAGSVIRMIQHIMTESLFRDGLELYLKSLPMGSGTPEKLYTQLQEALGDDSQLLPKNKNMKDVFGSWADAKGYPVVHAERSDDGTNVVLKQEVYSPSIIETAVGGQWYVPLTWATSSNINFENTTSQDWILPDTNKTISINKSDKWYIINLQQSGYYRVLYDEENWDNLIEVVSGTDRKNLHTLNKAQLIDDAFEFARTFRISYNTTFGLINYLRNETDYIPWVSASRGINFLNIMMPAADNYEKYLKFISDLSDGSAMTFQVSENDEHLTKLKRVLLLTISCNSGNKKCINEASSLLDDLINKKYEKLNPDIEAITYCSAMKKGTKKQYDFMWEKYFKSSVASERTLIVNSLACSQNPADLELYLSMSINQTSGVKEADRYLIVRSVALASPIGLESALNFTFKKFPEMKDSFPSQTSQIISTIGSRIIIEKQAILFKEFEKTYNKNFSQSEKDATVRALAQIEANRKWFDYIIKDVDPWLNENVNSATLATKSLSLILLMAFISMLSIY